MPRHLALVLALTLSAACVPRARLNTDCRWVDDPATPLDLTSSTQRKHLTLDVIVAEELAVRYADARTVAPRGPVRDQCLAQLFPEISRAHALSLAEVDAARGRREGFWDIGVIGVFALAYAAISVLAADRVRRPFSESPRLAWLALFAAALPIAFIATLLGEAWALMAEGVRVSNMGHLSGFRGNRVPWRHYRVEILTGAVVLFWLVGLARTKLGASTGAAAALTNAPPGAS